MRRGGTAGAALSSVHSYNKAAGGNKTEVAFLLVAQMQMQMQMEGGGRVLQPRKCGLRGALVYVV